MKRVHSLMFIMILLIFSIGLFIYFLGLIDGFFQTFAIYVMYFGPPTFFILSPFFIFEIYPRLLIFAFNVPISMGRLSPLALIFTILAFSAIVSSFFKRIEIALFCSTSASLAASTQYICLLPLVGGEPLGLVLRTPLFLPIIPPSFLILLSSKNLYLIILPAILFGSSAILLFTWSLQKKMENLSIEPTVSKYIKIRKTEGGDLLAFMPLVMFLLAGFFQTQILQVEAPQYPLLLTFARDYPTGTTFVLVYLLIYLPVYLISLKINSRELDKVVRPFIPILVEESKKQKPLIPLESVRQLLGLESVNKTWVKEVLRRVATMSRKEGAIKFGILDDYLYFEEPLIRKLEKQGKREINEIAEEIQVDPQLLKKVYKRL